MFKKICNCPTRFSAKKTLPNGNVLYAAAYGYRAWPITIHNEKCRHGEGDDI